MEGRVVKLQEIEKLLEADVVKDGQFGTLGLLTHESTDMLVYLCSDGYISELKENDHISCVMTNEKLSGAIPKEKGVIVCSNPTKSFYQLHNYLTECTSFYGKDFDSVIGDGAYIHHAAQVASKNVRIGKNVRIESGAIVQENSIIEDDVVLRVGCVIGTSGFDFKRIGKEIVSVRHAGGVLLHRGVEVQSFSNIDCAVFGGFTEVGEDTKIDKHVHIAHHSIIGKRCLIAAHALVAGSSKVGDDVWMGPGAIISSNILIGDRAKINIGSIVTKDIKPEQTVSGNFAIDHNRFISFIKSIG